MNPQDEQDLRELQAELVAAERSPWQPRCVSRAFRRAAAGEAFVFTMQAWIDLDAARSPFVLGRLPDAEELFPRMEEAFRAFGHPMPTLEKCDGDELFAIAQMIRRSVTEAFSMRVKLEPPEGRKAKGNDDGMGDWLPVLACLKTQMGFTLSEALLLPVGQAFALLAGHRCNEGWRVAGETYEQRDIADDDEPPTPAEQDSGVPMEVTHG